MPWGTGKSWGPGSSSSRNTIPDILESIGKPVRIAEPEILTDTGLGNPSHFLKCNSIYKVISFKVNREKHGNRATDP